MSTGRPEPGEYAPYAADDMAFVPGDDAIEALRASARETLALFRELPEKRITYAPGKWTLKEVLGHLIDDERIFAYRALCVARADARPLPGFDEKDYVAATDFEARTFASLLREFAIVRESSIAFFDSLTPEEWLRRGIVNGYEASVRGLAFHIAAHELHHLRTVRERYVKRLG